MVVDPLRLLDCCMESDGATALVVTGVDRAGDLRKAPVLIGGISTLTNYRWSSPIWYTEDGTALGSSGHRAAADELYSFCEIGPEDLDVALFYDGATIGVLMAMEDWRLAERGEAAKLVTTGETRLGGRIPVNTHGGNLSETYLQGASHVVEAVRQLRGESHNQVEGARRALYASGMGYAPMGGVLLTRS
jgi:acetyl-CoA acetyltransferase